MKVNRVTGVSLALPDSFKTVTLRIQTFTLGLLRMPTIK